MNDDRPEYRYQDPVHAPVAEDDPAAPTGRRFGAGAFWGSVVGVAVVVAVIAAGAGAGVTKAMTPTVTATESVEVTLPPDTSEVEAVRDELAGSEASNEALESRRAEAEQALEETRQRLEAAQDKAREQQRTRRKAAKKREASSIGSGQFEVGKDVKAGTYKTSGPDGDNLSGCYYEWKNSTEAGADIVDNNIVDGPATVTLRDGQFFSNDGCSPFRRQ